MPNENGSLNASREFLFLFGCFENKKNFVNVPSSFTISLIFILDDEYTGRNTFLIKLGCVERMVVDSILLHAESGQMTIEKTHPVLSKSSL